MPSFEDFGLKFEGLSDVQIANLHLALASTEHMLGVAKGMLDTIKLELPRLERTVAVYQDALHTINAKQREWNR